MKLDINNLQQSQTPRFLADLGATFLRIGEGDSVADLACGTGEFLKYVAGKFNDVSLYGCDLESECCDIAKKTPELRNKNAEIECRDAFSLPEDKKFDKIFIQPPVGMRVEVDSRLRDVIEQTLGEPLRFSGNPCYDLLFAVMATQHIKNDGCALVVVSTSSCSNTSGRLLRKFLVEAGYLSCVISLPGKLLGYTSIPLTVLCLRKNCDETEMINGLGFDNQCGRKELTQGRGVALLDAAVQIGSDDVFVVKKKDIVSADYDIYPSKFFDPPYSYKYEVGLSEVTTVLRRGVVNGSKSNGIFNRRQSKANNYPFVRATNIGMGMLEGDFDEISKDFLPHRRIKLEDGDILLTKTGRPFKCAVVEELPWHEMYFQENLYLLRVDKRKVNPFYLCAYFISPRGQKMLAKAMVNGSTSSIPIKILRDLNIPLPNLENQAEIGDYFKHQITKIRKLKREIDEVVSETKTELMYEF